MTLTATEPLLNGRYEVKQELGSGGFGIVKSAYDHKLKRLVALKLEPLHANSLEQERKVYKCLDRYSGFPKIYDYFKHGDSSYLVMSLLGPSIYNKFNMCGRQVDLKTILIIADQLIDRIKVLHNSCYIHRDIKPDNLAMGTGKLSNTLYLLDFGLAKVFKEDNKHLKNVYRSKITGTPRFASIRSHKGAELSRRDDLESMAYTLIYLQKGTLPWQGLSRDNKDPYRLNIQSKKQSITSRDLCKGLEPEFYKFLEYAQKLKYAEKPDYLKIKEMFKSLFIRKGFTNDGVIPWLPMCEFIERQEQAKLQLIKLKKEAELKRKAEEKKKQEESAKKRKICEPSDDLFFPCFIPMDVRRMIVVENMLRDKFTSMPPIEKLDVKNAPCKPMTRKERTAELTALAEKQAEREQLFYSLCKKQSSKDRIV